VIAAAALVVVFALMLAELWLSIRNERTLVRKGAVAAPDPVYGEMRWAYPGAFLVMALEGWLIGPASREAVLAGAGLFAAGKLVKLWAIASLGERWTYRVFVLPDVPLVTAGPYRFIRHPNYVGVVGELVGMAIVTGARISGPLVLVYFSWLLIRRIRAEEKALKIG
jgi:methyltransferase